ncbi:L,D-transpeptidase catalytic domain-containing protein [Desulfonema magnum]|uniref:L,D-transpeptidase catalytic domain-containing protein n=2 Tax=Desulfonema magnum TaxID=45655 RepID=A0A975GSD9_9BACT|nr:L,D-transpeptidase catalytic domain-containing protein [Desulfonema magnum]
MMFISSGAAASHDEAANSEQIPDMLIPLDSGNGAEYAIVVEKETQQLFLYANDGTVKEVLRMNCSTGKVTGAKAVAGDLKTPEGIYFFIKEHKDKDLGPIYGTRAFPTDYPNLLDHIAGRTGSEIWLHGTNKPLKVRDSSGCVTLENSDIDTIAKYITLNRTPIIIVKKLSYGPFDVKLEAKTSVLNIFSEWKDALENGTYHDYLKFYDPEYLPDISWWSEWNKIRKTIHTAPEPFSVELENILIIKYNGTYVVLADQVINFSGREIQAGIRKFYLTEDHFRIIGEEYQGMSQARRDKQDNPFMMACRNLGTKEDKHEIANMLDDWLKAWSSKDIQEYGNHYASDFQSQGMNLKAWLRHKGRLNKKYKYIRVSKEKLVVKKSKQRRVVSFVQKYESNAFKAVGIKQLILKREDGQWKIYRETWKKI